MVCLNNEILSVKVDELGAELKSIYCSDIEYIWEGKPEIWSGTAPIMFPICSGVKEDRYIFEGKEYHLTKHGYAKNTLFDVEYADDTRAVFLHKSNEETKKVYPFEYELRIIFELNGKSLKTVYEVKNKGQATMYFNVGAHEAYATPEGIEDYDVIFDQEETLENYLLYGNEISDRKKIPMLKESRVLPLYDKYFVVDALVFKDVKSKGAVLRNRKTGRAVRVDFPNAPYFLLWHKHGAPYICLEPWNGICDIMGSSYDITEKEGITALPAGETFSFSHTITIL